MHPEFGYGSWQLPNGDFPKEQNEHVGPHAIAGVHTVECAFIARRMETTKVGNEFRRKPVGGWIDIHHVLHVTTQNMSQPGSGIKVWATREDAGEQPTACASNQVSPRPNQAWAV